MKRAIAAMAAVGAAVAMLTGCAASSSGSSGQHVTLTFWHGYTADDGKKLDKIIDDFNKSQHQVTVQESTKTWAVIENSLLPALTAKSGPELVALPAEDLPVYAGKGALQDLSSWYSSSANAKSLNKNAVTMEVVEGKKYGVPTGFVPLSVIYNKTMFQTAGITSFPKTWDEWVADAKKLTVTPAGSSTPTQYGLALPDHQTVANGVWQTLFLEGGGTIADEKTAKVDSSANVKTLTYWADAVRNDHISPTGLTGVAADNLFAAGKAAMEIAGPWMPATATDNHISWGLAPVPAGPVTQAASAIGVSMGITAQANSAQKAAAEKFFDYFYSKKVDTEWSLGSGWPPLRTDIPASDVSSNAVVAALTKMSSLARPLLPGVVDSSDVLSAVDDATQHAISGGESADAALKTAQSAAQAALSK
ncbi:ABC transporter substrate-binding protein [Humibacter ginsengiterrae]